MNTPSDITKVKVTEEYYLDHVTQGMEARAQKVIDNIKPMNKYKLKVMRAYTTYIPEYIEMQAESVDDLHIKVDRMVDSGEFDSFDNNIELRYIDLLDADGIQDRTLYEG